jgi:hypothetical protein
VPRHESNMRTRFTAVAKEFGSRSMRTVPITTPPTITPIAPRPVAHSLSERETHASRRVLCRVR